MSSESPKPRLRDRWRRARIAPAGTAVTADGGSDLPVCGNCHTLLQGPFCHQCGQPVRSPVRELWSLVRDGLGELFSLDGKFFSSLIPLLLRPGVLTSEYFQGRRFSFIRPFRLYLGLSILLFLLVSGRGEETLGSAQIQAGDPAPKSETATQAKAELPAKPDPAAPKPTAEATRTAPTATPDTTPPTTPPESTKAKEDEDDEDFKLINIQVDGKRWHPRDQPLEIPYTPKWLQDFINSQLIIIVDNGTKLENDPKALARSLIDHMPQSMFFLLPVFALLLKVLYLFKRRLYAEHLIVALHSHSFMFLSFALVLLLDMLAGAAPLLAWTIKWTQIALFSWIPIYLLLMQKRVYKQGWIMTLIKYSVVGVAYAFLIALTMVVAFLLALRFM